MDMTASERRCFAEYESRREADELGERPGHVDCADCAAELNPEDGESVVLLGEVRCSACTIRLALQAWTDPAAWAAYTLAERAEILDVLGAEANAAEAEIRRQIRAGRRSRG